jgi:hypothetical protein
MRAGSPVREPMTIANLLPPTFMRTCRIPSMRAAVVSSVPSANAA